MKSKLDITMSISNRRHLLNQVNPSRTSSLYQGETMLQMPKTRTQCQSTQPVHSLPSEHSHHWYFQIHEPHASAQHQSYSPSSLCHRSICSNLEDAGEEQSWSPPNPEIMLQRPPRKCSICRTWGFFSLGRTVDVLFPYCEPCNNSSSKWKDLVHSHQAV